MTGETTVRAVFQLLLVSGIAIFGGAFIWYEKTWRRYYLKLQEKRPDDWQDLLNNSPRYVVGRAFGSWYRKVARTLDHQDSAGAVFLHQPSDEDDELRNLRLEAKKWGIRTVAAFLGTIALALLMVTFGLTT